MGKKKICIIAAVPGSIVAFWKTNIEKISQAFDVYVACNYGNPSVFEGLQIKGCKSINIERRPSVISFLKAVDDLSKYFEEEKFDAFISMSSNASLVAAIAGRSAQIPFRARIFTGQVWCHMDGLKRQFFKTIDRFTVAMNTNYLVDGRSQQEYLVENGILKDGQSVVLANGSICGVDIQKFCPNAEKRKEERERLGFKDGDIVYTFMGRINREKGTYELLDAFNMLAKDHKYVKLMLIGNSEGIDNSTFEKYENIRFKENLICYGFTKTPYWALQAGDVFCLPSYREGFGMSVIEAAALGMPVVASDAYGMRDSFLDGVTGKMCKVKDVRTLYECMKFMYENPDICKKYGEAGRKRVVEMFSMELVSNAWLEYFVKNV